MPIWNARANEIFATAVELPPEQRQAYLEHTCAGDADLRRQVEALLAAHARAGSFLDRPLVAGEPEVPTTTLEAADSGPPLAAEGGVVQALSDLPARYQMEGEIARGGMGAVLHAHDSEVGREVAVHPSRHANGLTFDLQGRLVVAGWSARTIWRVEQDGSFTTLASRYQGAKFNSPNDIVVRSDGTIYWSLIYDRGIIKSTDQGKTWTQTIQGGTLKTGHPIELPDGRIVAPGPKTLMISKDKGVSFQPVGETLPFAPNSITYSPYRNAFFIEQFDCGNAVLADAISRAGFDYRAP